MKVQPYLNFDGRCQEALDFYQRVLGAKVTMLMRYNESPAPPPPGMMPPGAENNIMHAALTIGESEIFASDGHSAGNATFKGIALSLTVKTVEEAERVFKELSAGGSVQAPLSETFFSKRFGMASDQFGVGWMVIVTPM